LVEYLYLRAYVFAFGRVLKAAIEASLAREKRLLLTVLKHVAKLVVCRDDPLSGLSDSFNSFVLELLD